MGRLKTIIAFAIAGMVAPGAAHAATVTIISNSTAAVASDYSSSGNGTDSYTGTSIPTSQSLYAVQAGNISDATINYSTSGAQTILSGDFEQTRTAGVYDYAQIYSLTLNFTVDVNTTYELSGHMNTIDIGSQPGLVYFYSYLQDTTNGTTIVNSLQRSQNTGDENFTLGLEEGDYTNNFSGALTGQLIAGHVYGWFFNAYVQALPDSNGGATAEGNFTLKIGAENAIGTVPLPPAIALFMPGLALLGFFGMRGKRSAVA